MRRHAARRAAAAVTLCLCMAACLQSQAEPTSYPLVCLAGGNYRFSLNVNEQSTTATIRFERGTAGVGKNFENMAALEPGHCAWLDRGVSENEPEVILHTVIEKPFFALEWTAEGSRVEPRDVRLGNVTVSLLSDLLKHHPYLGGLVEAKPGQHEFFVFQVYNNQQGYFVVTKLGL